MSVGFLPISKGEKALESEVFANVKDVKHNVTTALADIEEDKFKSCF